MARRSINIEGYNHQNPIPMACRVGNVIASSVISAVDPETGATPEAFEDQCALLFANIRAILHTAGATPEHVVKVCFYMPDLSERAVMNRYWLELFPDENSRPARHAQKQDLPPPRLLSADFLAIVERRFMSSRYIPRM